jgi:hypothetical protein
MLLPVRRAARRAASAVIPFFAAVASASPRAVEAQSPAPVASAADTGLAVVAGYVVEPGGQPVAGAEVLVMGTSLTTRVDVHGAYRLERVPPGSQVVRVRRLGFRPRTVQLDVVPHVLNDLDAVLEPTAQVLAGVVIQAENGDMIGQLERFARHKKLGQGYYLTPSEIARRHAIGTADLARELPAAVVRKDGTVASNRGRTPNGCHSATIFLDGTRLADNSTLDDIPASTVAAIEFYPGDAAVPQDLAVGGSAGCGVVAVWTKTR